MLQSADLIKMAMDEEPQILEVPALKEEDKNKHNTLRKVHDAVVDGALIAAGALPTIASGITSLDNPAPVKSIV